MNLLFIQGGSRVRTCNNGKNYVDGNFNNNIWKRYASYTDKLTVILRGVDSIFDEKNIKNKFNIIDEKILDLKIVPDIYYPKINFFKKNTRKRIKEVIEENVKKADKVIIRSIGNYYTNMALKYCKKYNKDYLIEVTGFAFEGLWYHSLFGKLLAIPREMKLKKEIKKAFYAVYVTKTALQKRYPCDNKKLGCSDVEIEKISNEVLNERIKKIENIKEHFKLGTLAFLDVKWKGQIDVLKAMHELKKNGNLFFSYELVGSGSGNLIKKYIKKYDLEEDVKILGVKPHKEVFEWLDQIDVYIQPSYQEGLCRAIVEAMSRGCPVIASNVGGNFELIDRECIYKKGNVKDLIKKILDLKNRNLIEISNDNFAKAKKFEKSILDDERNSFYMKFCKG